MSPLGKYGPLTATVISIGVVAAFVIGTLFRSALGLDDASVQSLRELALLGVGNVSGQSVGMASTAIRNGHVR